MRRRGSTKKHQKASLIPNGFVYATQVIKDSADDGLTHFQWKERTPMGSNPAEDDIILLPEEASFERCQQAGSSARVMMLSLQDKHLFFWMQVKHDA